jgi:hypothetical protein
MLITLGYNDKYQFIINDSKIKVQMITKILE